MADRDLQEYVLDEGEWKKLENISTLLEVVKCIFLVKVIYIILTVSDTHSPLLKPPSIRASASIPQFQLQSLPTIGFGIRLKTWNRIPVWSPSALPYKQQ